MYILYIQDIFNFLILFEFLYYYFNVMRQFHQSTFLVCKKEGNAGVEEPHHSHFRGVRQENA